MRSLGVALSLLIPIAITVASVSFLLSTGVTADDELRSPTTFELTLGWAA